ncbi:MAG: nitronate monooxygenase [Candidatus Izimaplasma sp.]|nr:nitronate monooxygenase [Candidatus Izimaplasma bacterium]
MKKLIIGNTHIDLPIIQGGMGVGISLSNLASAVANEGGIGVISAAGVGLFYKESNDYAKNNRFGLRQEIRKTRALTNGKIGVNIMVAFTNYSDLVQVAIEEEVDFIFVGAGLPLDLPKYLKEDSKTKLVPIISSGRAAKIIIKKWQKNFNYLPDAFIVEGPLAGGHLGFKKGTMDDDASKLENLLVDVLNTIAPIEQKYDEKIPLIAAGGIYTGEDIYRFINKGASAVQMGTRFVATHECDASNTFKQSYIDSNEKDMVYIESPVGLPGRAIYNPFLEDVEKGLKHPFNCPYNCIHTCPKEEAPYCIILALFNAKIGKLKNGFAFAGKNAHRIKKILSVKELIHELIQGYKQAELNFA